MVDQFGFKLNEKKITLPVHECKTSFSQAMGLMFRKQSPVLLFTFKSSKNRSIHSFFCVPFIALWFQDDVLVGVEHIFPWRFSVKPKKPFNRLIEIPQNSDYYRRFVDDIETFKY